MLRAIFFVQAEKNDEDGNNKLNCIFMILFYFVQTIIIFLMEGTRGTTWNHILPIFFLFPNDDEYQTKPSDSAVKGATINFFSQIQISQISSKINIKKIIINVQRVG